MDTELLTHILELKNKKNIWSEFLMEALRLNNEDIIVESYLHNRMVFINDKIEFKTDPVKMNTIDKLVLKRAGINLDYNFTVPNFRLINGKADCIKHINNEIIALEQSINSLRKDIKE